MIQIANMALTNDPMQLAGLDEYIPLQLLKTRQVSPTRPHDSTL
jgi:hypothetical protein